MTTQRERHWKVAKLSKVFFVSENENGRKKWEKNLRFSQEETENNSNSYCRTLTCFWTARTHLLGDLKWNFDQVDHVYAPFFRLHAKYQHVNLHKAKHLSVSTLKKLMQTFSIQIIWTNMGHRVAHAKNFSETYFQKKNWSMNLNSMVPVSILKIAPPRWNFGLKIKNNLKGFKSFLSFSFRCLSTYLKKLAKFFHCHFINNTWQFSCYSKHYTHRSVAVFFPTWKAPSIYILYFFNGI